MQHAHSMQMMYITALLPFPLIVIAVDLLTLASPHAQVQCTCCASLTATVLLGDRKFSAPLHLWHYHHVCDPLLAK